MLPPRLKNWFFGLDPDLRAFAVGYVLVLPFYLAPLLVTRFLPGLDLPFHLTIADLLMKAGDPASPYAPYYVPRLGLAPYAIHYFGLIGLGQIFELATAHRMIMVGYLAALPLAMANLLSVCGRSRLPALLAFPMAYNLCLHYGFISFCLSLPVLVLLFALIGRFVTRDDAGLATVGLIAITGVALFLSHLQNFLFGLAGGLTVIAFCRAPWRRRWMAAAGLLPALLCLVYWAVSSGYDNDPASQRNTVDFAWNAVKTARINDMDGLSVWGDLKRRVRWLPEMALRGFHDGSDIVASRTLLLLIAGYALMGGVAAFLPRLRVPPSRLRVACWILLGGAAFAFFALPHHLREFELMTFYPRFAVLVLLFLLPLVPAGLRRIGGRMRYGLLVPVFVFAVFHGHGLWKQYRAYRDEIVDFREVLRRTPRGGKATAFVFNRASAVINVESPFVGMMGYYVAVRSAPTSMVPAHYCGMRHMPCGLVPGAPPVPYPGPWLDRPYDWNRMVQEFDYVFLRFPPPTMYRRLNASGFQMLATHGSWAVLHKPKPPVPAAPPPAPPRDAGAATEIDAVTGGALGDSAAATTTGGEAP